MDKPIQLIPAECGNCGYLYPSGYGFDPDATGIEVSMTVFEHAEVEEPCPMCGRHRGRVLAGEHQFVRDAEKLLRGSGRDAEGLEEIAEFVRGARERSFSAEEVREWAAAPEVLGIVEDLLKVRPERVEMARWYALLDATLRALANESDEEDGKLEPSLVVYDSVSPYNVTTVQPSSMPDEGGHGTQKVGRNDPCPCGSGKKYKKCHGDPTSEVATA